MDYIAPLSAHSASSLTRVSAARCHLEQHDLSSARHLHALVHCMVMLPVGQTKPHAGYVCAAQGTGTADEVAMSDRQTIASEGIVIAAVEVFRPGKPHKDGQGSASSPPSGQGEPDGEGPSSSGRGTSGNVVLQTCRSWLRGGLNSCCSAPVLLLGHRRL